MELATILYIYIELKTAKLKISENFDPRKPGISKKKSAGHEEVTQTSVETWQEVKTKFNEIFNTHFEVQYSGP